MGFFSTSKSAKLKSLHPARHAAAKLWKTGDVDEALDAALEGLDADPGDAVALHALVARCHAANRDFADAATHFAAALDAVPLDERPDDATHAETFDEAHFLAMGDACHRAERHAECVFAFDSALELAARDANRGGKRWGSARAARTKTADGKPLGPLDVGSSATHYFLGVSLGRVGDYLRAVAHLERVAKPLEVALGGGDVLCEMERCFRALNLPAEADACLKRAAEETPPVRPENAARVAVFRYERLGGSDVQCVSELEACLAKAKRAEGSQGGLSPSGGGDSAPLGRRRESEIRAMLGRAHRAMGDDAAAEKHLTAACAADPRNADAFARLGELYVASDRDDVAMRAFAVAVELVEREEDGKEGSGEEAPSAPSSPRVGGAVDSSLLATKAAALAGMASIYEKHGQPGRAYETYERMDDADPRVANRKREILTAAAVKLQRVFRGNKAREAMRKAARGRVARRQYGAVLAPRPIHNRGEGSGVVLADTGASLGGGGAFAWAQTPLARDGGRENRARGAGGFKTLGSSFF